LNLPHLDDLDDFAIAKAKIMFAKVHNRITKEEINAWSDEEFLVPIAA
jgi:ATP-dependent DNA helicase RecG